MQLQAHRFRLTKKFQHKIVNIFLPISCNMFSVLKRTVSFEYPKLVLAENKENYNSLAKSCKQSEKRWILIRWEAS